MKKNLQCQHPLEESFQKMIIKNFYKDHGTAAVVAAVIPLVPGLAIGMKKGGIMISMHNGGGWEKGEGCTTQRRQVGILQHFAILMDSDCKGVYTGDLV